VDKAAGGRAFRPILIDQGPISWRRRWYFGRRIHDELSFCSCSRATVRPGDARRPTLLGLLGPRSWPAWLLARRRRHFCEGQRGAHHDPVIPPLDVWLFSAGLIVTSFGSPGPKDQATRACCGLCWLSVRVSRAHATWGPIQRALVALRGIACHRVRTTISRCFVRSRMT
jgi:hypothetical protein